MITRQERCHGRKAGKGRKLRQQISGVQHAPPAEHHWTKKQERVLMGRWTERSLQETFVAIELLIHNVPKSATLGGLRKLTLPQVSHSPAHKNLSGLRNNRPDAVLIKLPSMYDQEQNGPLPKYRFTKAWSQRSAVPILCAAAAGRRDGGRRRW